MAHKLLGDGCLRNFDSNLQQFSVKARSDLARVGKAHLANKTSNFCTYVIAHHLPRFRHVSKILAFGSGPAPQGAVFNCLEQRPLALRLTRARTN